MFFNFDVKLFYYITENSNYFFRNLSLIWYDIIAINKRYTFIRIHFLREKEFNYFIKFFIGISVLNTKTAIMSFCDTYNEFYTLVTLLIICFFILIRSATKKFISHSWSSHYFFIDFFRQKRGLICPSIFLFVASLIV